MDRGWNLPVAFRPCRPEGGTSPHVARAPNGAAHLVNAEHIEQFIDVVRVLPVPSDMRGTGRYAEREFPGRDNTPACPRIVVPNLVRG